MKKTKYVYRFDDEGYLIGDTLVQEHPVKAGQWMIPDDCTELKPELSKIDKYFPRFVDGQWTYEEIPQSAGFFIGKKVSHKSQKQHDRVLRALLQELVKKDPEHFRVIRGSKEEGLWWSVEAIPEKTAEQKALEEKNSEISTLKYKLQSTDYVAAKIAEGAATKEEYADILAERESWRQQIRSLEPEVEALLIQVEAQTDGEQSC